MKYALVISYLGTRYCGWQRQKGSAADGNPSIQETIEVALSKIAQEKVTLKASGRTDAGVHACGQVAHFKIERTDWVKEKIQKGLNSVLPVHIRIMSIHEVPDTFHAQASAYKKQYSYYFQQGPCELPHLAKTSLWIRKDLDLRAMQESLKYIVGRHDFKPFQSAGAQVKTTVREIFEAGIERHEIQNPNVHGYHLLKMTVLGSGFLKHMVRGIAGTVLQVGEGKRPPDQLRKILENQDRTLLGATAQPRGLWLEKVWYRDVAF